MTEQEKLEIYRQVLDGRLESDFVVLDNVGMAPPLNVDYHSQYYYIGLCRSGLMRCRYDYRDLEFKAGDICWVIPDHLLSHSYVSPDYRVLSVFIKRSYVMHLRQQGVLGHYHFPTYLTHMSLPPERFETICDSFRLIMSVQRLGVPHQEELVALLVHLIAMLCDYFIEQGLDGKPRGLLKNEDLFERFYADIIACHRQSREVAFYAHRQCLSPKYFATLVRQLTGVAASEWINSYVMLEAKRLLLRVPHAPVEQVARELGFCELPSFSRFFRQHEGQTPSEFRKSR